MVRGIKIGKGWDSFGLELSDLGSILGIVVSTAYRCV